MQIPLWILDILNCSLAAWSLGLNPTGWTWMRRFLRCFCHSVCCELTLMYFCASEFCRGSGRFQRSLLFTDTQFHCVWILYCTELQMLHQEREGEVARCLFPRSGSLLPKGIIGRAYFDLEHAVLIAFSPTFFHATK